VTDGSTNWNAVGSIRGEDEVPAEFRDDRRLAVKMSR